MKIKSISSYSVTIDHEPVELCKILKFENLVLSGGEAKQAILNGMVTVNGKIELQKRKKIFAGDVIEFNGHQMKIVKKASSAVPT
ncbi:MAG: RNA-binding S4 domain-containing protein [Desulfamplus sp.]|jgi:ribosome-associated protein|nr:RNA-binding S4 domain-containing protein [Desulfamplus sp.]MBF0241201.1 RNA-binding S4 domain-containing protein [Desulfamplus sp.]MBF0389931.1 RNA-binding S4 domain-containing protein [Desulfamplus sp.]